MDPWVVKLLGLWVNTGINREKSKVSYNGDTKKMDSL